MAGGYALPMVLVVMMILVILAVGETMTSYSSRIQAVRAKAEAEAMLAAEAGYERAIFWMSQQGDILGALQAGGGSGNIAFGTSSCSYDVDFSTFIGARPIFQVTSTGTSGRPAFSRIVDVSVIQETAGWAMGTCRVPTGASSTSEVYFKTGEIVDMPLHINKFNDSPDERDIWINGTPRFLRRVEMGEARRTSGGSDKYSGVISLFEGGIYFEQPGIRITDESAVQSKVNRFRDSTNFDYRFTPKGTANFSTSSTICKYDAVQLEFFVDPYGIGKVRITNNCTIKGYMRSADNRTYDYNTVPGTGGSQFQRYYIYAYHYGPNDVNCPNDLKQPPIVVPIENTYVTQHFGGYESEPGGQIFVDGHVVIGGDGNEPNQVVKGKITVVATGNIWIADNIVVDGSHDINGIPASDNPNVLGLIARGVVKVVDPGMSSYTGTGSPNYYPGPPPSASGYTITDVNAGSCLKHTYKPVGNLRAGATYPYDRVLPDPTIVEAAITTGGGGFGAENVQRGSYGGRKEFSGDGDILIVRGSLTEVVRGVVGVFSSSTGNILDGYEKNYYIDNRLMSGILPADIWFTGKYIPAPAGWHDHSIKDD
jgi:type II secretory pathway pseudopilin PulG